MSESEKYTYKLYIPMHTSQVMHMLPRFRNAEQAALGCAVWLEILRLQEL